MKFFSVLMLMLICGVSVCGNVIRDPEFKKYKDLWVYRTNAEFKQYKPAYKKGVFSINLKHSSSARYCTLSHQIELKEGKKYLFSIDTKTQGDGQIGFYVKAGFLGLDKKEFKAVKKSGSKPINLGLSFHHDQHNNQWQTHKIEFVVKDKPYTNLNDVFHIYMGAFQGQFSFRNISISEIE
jgi:hypothetical protein